MRGLVVFGILVSTVVVCVLSDTDQPAQQDASEVAVRADQLTHGHRSKRSPYDPILPALVVGKSFLLGALVGKAIKGRGWGWRPRVRGWGWPKHHHHHAPVVVHHAHSHGGWGGWEEPVSVGWGWAR